MKKEESGLTKLLCADAPSTSSRIPTTASNVAYGYTQHANLPADDFDDGEGFAHCCGQRWIYLSLAEAYNNLDQIGRATRPEQRTEHDATGWAQALRVAGASEKAERERVPGANP